MLMVITSLQWILSSLCETTIFPCSKCLCICVTRRLGLSSSSSLLADSVPPDSQSRSRRRESFKLLLWRSNTFEMRLLFFFGGGGSVMKNKNKEKNRNTLVFSLMVALFWMSSLCWSLQILLIAGACVRKKQTAGENSRQKCSGGSWLAAENCLAEAAASLCQKQQEQTSLLCGKLVHDKQDT